MNTYIHTIRPYYIAQAIFLAVLLSFITSVSGAHASEVTPQKVLELVNESRLSHGLDMFEKQYFSHNTPEGTEPWYWIENEGYDYKYAGENLAINFVSAEKQHAAWMESPTHRKNILNAQYQDMGVAAVSGKFENTQTIIVVQFFGQKMNVSAQAMKDAAEQASTQLASATKGAALEPQLQSVKNAYKNTFTPTINAFDDSYEMAVSVISLLFILIVIVDILILNYMQIRNIYPIIKEFLIHYERQEG
jgi:hypothetical protein